MTSKRFLVEFVGPSSHREVRAEWLSVRTPTGDFTIGPGHNPIVSLIKAKSLVRFSDGSGEPLSLEVSGGILIVGQSGGAKLLLWEE